MQTDPTATQKPRLSLPMWTERYAAPFAPTTAAEVRDRGWDAVDVVFVSGDAYIDHPSFAAAILHRVLEQAGFRVAVLSQPDWRSVEPWRQFGRPRLFYAVSAGNMDSLINHYTANKKVRNDDAYSPGGRIGLRPDRATLVQFHDRQAVVQTPPALPLSREEMDAVYDLPFTRRPHPSYTEPIPAHEMIKDSVTIMRGCFGGCTFCSITAHQGRIIQSRSEESVIQEVRKLAADPEFKGVISDVGGATANMYRMRCTRPEVEARCKRLSCVHPTICKLLGTDHDPLVKLLREVRQQPGVRKAFVASGIRMDLAQLSPEYVRELAEHHTGGRLKVAPEHTSPTVLETMKKPPIDNFGAFAEQYKQASAEAGKPRQQIVPYFIASHPGSGLAEMIDLALYLKRNGYRPDQVQDFIPAPFDIATCMYYTGIDPFTKKPVVSAHNLKDRKMQRALMQFFKPENYFDVREALIQAGRTDLIGGCEGLIPAQPPKEAIEARRRAANSGGHDHYHSVANPTKGEPPGERGLPNKGYRPGRKSAGRRKKGRGEWE